MTLPVHTILLSTLLTLSIGTAIANSGHSSVNYPKHLELQTTHQNHNGFGRLFRINAPGENDGATPLLRPHPSPRHDLLRLGRKMIDEGNTAVDTNMPLAYVFLGQFIDHDITLDTISGLGELIGDTSGLENARTVDLDLDCVYGGGPERSPYLFDGAKLRVGAITIQANANQSARHDLIRMPKTSGAPTALIGDPRNDENFVISQIQAAFIAYHNRMVDRLIERELIEIRDFIADELDEATQKSVRSSYGVPASAQIRLQRAKQEAQIVKNQPALNAEQKLDKAIQEYRKKFIDDDKAKLAELLERARALTVHHYHRVIVEDFLPRIIGTARVKHMLQNGRSFYFPTGFRDGSRLKRPFIPIEFSVAAYRFGHSQVPARLALRNGANGKKVTATLFHTRGMQADDLVPTSFTPIQIPDASLALDWNLQLDIRSDSGFETAQSLDTKLSEPLAELVKAGVVRFGEESNLASRNLSRGRSFELPSGQDLAAVVLAKLLANGALDTYLPKNSDPASSINPFLLDADKATRQSLTIDETPLWYYVLQEAKEFGAPDGRSKWRLPKVVTKLSKNEKQARRKGATLGPVGATIVGETLLGLIEHYRVSTGEGIDLNAGLENYVELAANGAAVIEKGELTETVEETGLRYLLRNFIFDAGLGGVIDEGNVLPGKPA